MQTTSVTVRTTDRDRLRQVADDLGGVPSHRLVGAMLLAWLDLPVERQYALLSQTTGESATRRRSRSHPAKATNGAAR